MIIEYDDDNMCYKIEDIVGNKADGRISKWVLQ